MKNLLKILLSSFILFGSIPILQANSSNGMYDIKNKKKKANKLNGKAGKGKKGGWGKWKSKWKKKKTG